MSYLPYRGRFFEGALSRKAAPKRRRGFILVAVLVVIAALSLAALQLGLLMTEELQKSESLARSTPKSKFLS